jgi:hypothetical protein
MRPDGSLVRTRNAQTAGITTGASPPSIMRITNFLLSITVCLAIFGAYVAGHYMGESDGREAGADATFNLDASRSAEAFMIASSVRQALRESKPAQAELVVVRYAALKAPSLVACSSSPDCAASVGRLMPTKAQLEEALVAERAMRDQR